MNGPAGPRWYDDPARRSPATTPRRDPLAPAGLVLLGLLLAGVTLVLLLLVPVPVPPA